MCVCMSGIKKLLVLPDLDQILKLMGTCKVSQKVVLLHNGFKTLLCNYLCDMGYFF